MKAILPIISLCLLASSAVQARGLEQIADSLTLRADYLANAHFEVLLPSAIDPVEYDALLQSSATPADTLSPCEYLIRWSAQTPSGPNAGFSAYFDGNLYRYRNARLQEYHAEDSPEPFAPNGNKAAGVQSTTQFADLLPQYLAQKLRAMAADSSYKYVLHPDTTIGRRRAVAVDGVKYNNGYESQLFIYAFDFDTLDPIYIDITTSPGAISEQVITVTYTSEQPSKAVAPLSEQALIDLWPDVFEKYRQSTFRAESLIGNFLPDFSCQKLGGSERLAHKRGDSLSRPALIVVLDPKVASAASTIAQVRAATDFIDADVVWAFTTNHAGDIEEMLGAEARVGETALPSAGSLIRNCGVTLYPTIIMVSADGKVADVLSGHNQDVSSVVIQKAKLLF